MLHVPLLIKHPTLKPKKINELVQLVDITPTLLNFLGIPKEKSFEGKNLVPLIMKNKSINNYVLAGSTFTPSHNNSLFNTPSIVRAVRTKDFKLINEKMFSENFTVSVDSYEFYDIRNDPKELHNIYLTADASLLSRLVERLPKVDR